MWRLNQDARRKEAEEAEEVEQPSLLDGGTIRSCLSQLKKKKEKRLRLRRRDEALGWHFPGQSQHSQIIAITIISSSSLTVAAVFRFLFCCTVSTFDSNCCRQLAASTRFRLVQWQPSLAVVVVVVGENVDDCDLLLLLLLLCWW